MLSAFASAFRTPDLRKKLLFTLAHASRCTGSARRSRRRTRTSRASTTCINRLSATARTQDIYSLINLFSGGALLQLSVFALGIMPYITASIIIQLLVVVIPRFEQLKKEGQSGQQKLTQYSRYLTIGLAILQSTGFVALARSGQLFPGCNESILYHDGHLHALASMVISMTAGTGVIMWLGELITDRGVGNGMSVLMFTSIAARIPTEGKTILQNSGGFVFTLIICARPGHHRRRRLRRAGPAPDPGAVREAHDRPTAVRRHLDLPAAEGQPGRCHPGHLRLVAALHPAADQPADQSNTDGGVRTAG